MLKVLGKLERSLAGLRLRFGIEGGAIRIEAEPGFFDPPGAAVRVEKARKVLDVLLGALESPLRIAGLPDCFLPGAHDRLEHPRKKGTSYRRAKSCGACRFDKACPGIPLRRGTKLDGELLASWFKPVPHALDEIAIEATGHCNFQCGICLIVNTRKTQPSAADLRRVIDETKAAGASTVRFTGGEPLLRKDLFELARYAKDAGLSVFLNTNGSLLNDRTIALMEKSVDSALVSVQGHDPDSEQRLTGAGALFRSKLANLKKLACSKVPVVRVNTIMSKTLLQRKERYVEILQNAGVRYWVLTRPLHGSGPAAAEYSLSREEFVSGLRFLIALRKKGIETYVGDAVPFCVAEGARYDVLFEANSLTESRRLVYDCRGFYKPSYEMNTDLGKTLPEARRHPFLKRLWSLEHLPPPCSACHQLKNCLGGNRFMARETSGTESAPDPLMGIPIGPDRCNDL